MRGSGLCLSQEAPPPQQPPYARVCGRLQGFNEFNPKQAVPAYCLQLGSDATWWLTSGAGMALANGNVTPAPAQGEPVPVGLAFNGSQVTAAIRGLTVASVASSEHTAGRVALGTSFGGMGGFAHFAVGPL